MKSLGILEKPLNKKTPIIYKITKKIDEKKGRRPLPFAPGNQSRWRQMGEMWCLASIKPAAG
jgi:hypothetical protein